MDVLLQRHVALVSADPDVNILQLCVVRMLWLPVVLVLLRFGVALTMLISFVIWMLANAAGESWHCNPLTWQLLFTTGIVAAVLTQRNGVTARREWVVPGVIFTPASPSSWPAPWVPISWLPETQLIPRDVVANVSKTYLSGWRVVHILALGCLAAPIVPRSSAWLPQPLARMISACGMNALETFALGTILSFLAWIVLNDSGQNRSLEFLINTGGIITLLYAAVWLSRIKLQRADVILTGEIAASIGRPSA
jgi:hypothetical protein